MNEPNDVFGKVLTRLTERVKELDCIYSVEELLRDKERSKEDVFRELLKVIPPGWQYPTICEVRIHFEGKDFASPELHETEWVQSADLVIDNNIAGKIEVYYNQFIREVHGSQFLPEEQKLLNTIAERVSSFIFSQRLRHTLGYLKAQKQEPGSTDDLKDFLPSASDEHWKWRMKMAQHIADAIAMQKYAIRGVYVIGSTKNATAGPSSDIDLIVHHQSEGHLLDEFIAWIDGWGQALSVINFARTGYSCGSLIDLHLVTDTDIAHKSSYAAMIGRLENGAKQLR
jgi:predicted nucleotidyltransferase